MLFISDETPADAANDFGNEISGDGFGLETGRWFDLPEPQISNVSVEVSEAKGKCAICKVVLVYLSL